MKVTPQCLTQALVAATIFLQAAYVTTVCFERPVAWMIGASAATSAFTFTLVLPRGPLADVMRIGFPYHLVYGALAWILHVFDIYAAAFAFALVILFVLDVSHARGLVTYETRAADFVVSRAALYGALRAGAVAVANASPSNVFTSTLLPRLLPTVVGVVETVGMYVLQSTSYTFHPHSLPFAVYAILKTQVFLLLPLAEDAARTVAPPWM